MRVLRIPVGRIHFQVQSVAKLVATLVEDVTINLNDGVVEIGNGPLVGNREIRSRCHRYVSELS